MPQLPPFLQRLLGGPSQNPMIDSLRNTVNPGQPPVPDPMAQGQGTPDIGSLLAMMSQGQQPPQQDPFSQGGQQGAPNIEALLSAMSGMGGGQQQPMFPNPSQSPTPSVFNTLQTMNDPNPYKNMLSSGLSSGAFELGKVLQGANQGSPNAYSAISDLDPGVIQLIQEELKKMFGQSAPQGQPQAGMPPGMPS
jgi:hypothetical protein